MESRIHQQFSKENVLFGNLYGIWAFTDGDQRWAPLLTNNVNKSSLIPLVFLLKKGKQSFYGTNIDILPYLLYHLYL